MSDDRSDIIICGGCGIVVNMLPDVENKPIQIGDVVLLGYCNVCNEE